MDMMIITETNDLVLMELGSDRKYRIAGRVPPNDVTRRELEIGHRILHLMACVDVSDRGFGTITHRPGIPDTLTIELKPKPADIEPWASESKSPATAIGEKVLALADGREILDPVTCGVLEGDSDIIEIGIVPKPLTGLKWLMSLPVWTIIKPLTTSPVLILSDGFQYKSGDKWKWNQLVKGNTASWIENACPSTCPEWKPEKEQGNGTEAPPTE